MRRSRPLRWRIPSAAVRCRRRSPNPARGASVEDPALAELVRKEQDLSKQVNAQLGVYNNLLSVPSEQRDANGVKGIAASIEKLRGDRDKARAEINAKFPAYADLVSPKDPPTVEQIKATLVSGEALLSFYFGSKASFVWAVRKDGAVAFASIPASRRHRGQGEQAAQGAEPQAAMISDIPPFRSRAGARPQLPCCWNRTRPHGHPLKSSFATHGRSG